MKENTDMNFSEKIKTDKKFRFEFIIGIWSGVVVLALVVALIFVGKIFLFNNNSIDGDETVQDGGAAVTGQAVVAVSETPEPYDNAIINGNEEDWETEDVDEDLKDASYAYATTTVNMRNEAALTASVIAKLHTGDKVKILEYDKEWTKVSFEGNEGYVSTIYLSVSKPQNPVYTSAPQATVKPTQKPLATKKPKATKKPNATKKPKATTAPDHSAAPTEPTTVPEEQKPASTKVPEEQKPVSTKTPEEQKPASTKVPEEQKPAPVTPTKEPSETPKSE